MAKKISQLTQATEVKSDDVTVIVQDGETKKLPLNMMVTKQDIENKKVAGLAKLDEIEATYENDTYTPTITVENKSSVKVGEGDGVDYSANVMDGHVKSAILKGRTLVNCLNTTSFRNYGNVIAFNLSALNMVKPSTSYLMYIIDETNKVGAFYISQNGNNVVIERTDGTKKKITTTENIIIDNQMLYIYPKSNESFADGDENKINAMLIEYQDGMENWDIPYFTGMQSVKMPVLTTTGKNLMSSSLRYDVFLENDGLESTFYQDIVSKEFIQVESSTRYAIATFYQGERLEPQNIFICEYDNGKNFIKRFNATSYGVFATDINTKYIKFSIGGAGIPGDIEERKKIFIELEKTEIKPTSYEPYKTNILTVNEDIELRGIGDVQDELNLLTGEVTERIGEIVLDGSDDEDYGANWNDDRTAYPILTEGIYNNMKINAAINCDKVKHTSNGIYHSRVNEIAWHANVLVLLISNEDTNGGNNVTGLKEYLSKNPITIQYQLATESIKTVDLIPSGTHPSTTPYCWKDGHIQLSSSGLLPSLEYSVVTSRAGQISQNAAMIVKNDKRIFDLEILLAGGLVNTTYQALTLQNQVETGLSKVSLSSEKEPDYLLYHMIMKLIEEKAYKLDDLTEKVSVFYLYEKLSDEQFETIYSELYPFVEEEYIELPEDGEIIEEPIVDEVLEEVENEVVM